MKSPRPSPLNMRPLAALAGVALALAVSLASAPAFAYPSSSGCAAPSSWFPHAKTPAPDANIFPGNTTATDCDFHQWAWQEFLYVTQDVGGHPRFLNYPTEFDLFPTDVTTKPATAAALRARSTHPMLRLKVRTTKAQHGGRLENANSIFQAGSGGVLVDHHGNPLYYSVHFNWVFYKFVESNSYYDYSTYIATNPSVTFPDGASEFKASWKIVLPGEPFAGYTTEAEVPTLSSTSTGDIVAGEPMRQVKVGLVGLHVVGVVANHPEFIWATFEQVENSPDLPPGMSATSDQPISKSNFTFYTAGTAAKDCNVQPKTYTLDAAKQTLSPITQVFRQFAFGGGTRENISAIESLNKNVHARLSPGDPVSHYQLIGGVWLLPGALVPNLSPGGSQLHGSPDLANSTMETFVQPPFKNPTPPPDYFTSCFGCHDTQATTTSTGLKIPPMNMNLSHILTDGLVSRENARRKLLKQ